MSKAVTAEVNKLTTTVAKHATKKDIIEQAVFKATQSTKEVPPKDKHLRTILEETHILGSGEFTFQEIFKRPVAEKEMILFKTLFIVHKMLRDGAPKCVVDIQNYSKLLKSLHGQYKSVNSAYGNINSIYLGFLIGKIDFHKKHGDVSGDVDVHKYREKGKKPTPKEAFDLCNSILELQKLVLAVEQKILQTGSLNACKVCPIVPLLYESFNLYNFAVSLLTTLVNFEESDPLIDLFNKQFPVIQKFYFQCTTIPYITSIVTKIPELSSIPVFELKGEKQKMSALPPPEPPKKEKKPKKPKPEPLPPVKPLSDILTTSVVFQTPGNLFGTYAPPKEPVNPFATQTFNPFAVAPAPPPPVVVQPPPPVVVQPPPPPVDPIGAENRENYKRRIRELEELIRQTEIKIKDQEAANGDLKNLLNQADLSVASAQEQMNRQLADEREAYMKANGALKGELDGLVASNQAEMNSLRHEALRLANLEAQQREEIEQELQRQAKASADADAQSLEAINRATRALVDAAASGNQAEELARIERANMAAQQSVQDEIEMTAAILRIQKQIEKANKKLGDIRSGKDSDRDVAPPPAQYLPPPQDPNPFLQKW